MSTVTDNVTTSQYKPFIKDLIRYYYQLPDKGAGGYLHIVLDDGNLDYGNIFWCQEEAEKAGDTFGVFLAEVLMEFSENELQEMYEDHFWGMHK